MTATRATLRTWLQSLPPPSPGLRREQQLTLAANLMTLVVAAWQQWSLAALIWPYWIQSVAIGAFNAHRMQSLRQFSTEGLKSGNEPVPTTAQGKGCAVAFFCFHYGFFHLIYLMFLASELPVGEELRWILVGSAGLVLAQAFAHMQQLRIDRSEVPNLGNLMFLPYLRILPVHLTILFGMPFALFGPIGGTIALLLFGALKTFADHGGIRIEDAVRRSGGSPFRTTSA